MKPRKVLQNSYIEEVSIEIKWFVDDSFHRHCGFSQVHLNSIPYNSLGGKGLIVMASQK